MTHERLTYYFNKYKPKLTWFLRTVYENNEYIDDVVSGAFLSLAGIEDRGDGQIYSYLKTKAKRDYINTAKSKGWLDKKHRLSSYHRDESYIQSLEIKQQVIYESVRQQEIIRYIKWRAGKMPPMQKKVFNMRFFSDMTNVEIAGKLKITPGAVGTLLKRSVDYMKLMVANNKPHLLAQEIS